MKRFSLSILLTMFMSIMGINVFAYDIAVENADGVTIYYNFYNEGKELEVTGKYLGTSENIVSYQGDVVIPGEVTYMNRTRKVTAIGDSAFCRCQYLSSVTIPNSVMTIGDSAFEGCLCMGPVIIPNGVTTIGSHAFEYCRDMWSVTIPNSVKRIGEDAFADCSNIWDVYISDIAAWCSISFSNSRSNPMGSSWKGHLYLNGEEVTDLVSFNSLTSINHFAFAGCLSLTSVTIPNSVEWIGDGAFYQCDSLTSVTIPNNIINIHDYTFYGCSSLTSVTIPNWVLEIGSKAFGYCSSLTSITIPDTRLDSVEIRSEAFTDCSSLTSIIIPKSVKTIGYGAFYGCPIKNVVVKKPENVYWGYSPFSNPTLYHAMLYVPFGTMWEAIYDGRGWWEFINIREMAFETGELSHSQAYTLMNSNSFGYAVYDAVNDEVRTTKSFYEIDESSPNSSWQLVNVNGSDCLYSIGAKKYAVINQNGQIELSTIPVPLSLKDADAGIVVGSDENAQWNFVLNDKVSIDHHVSAINTMTDNTSVVVKRHFTLGGQQVSEPRKGINIVKTGNQVVKVMVK